MPYDCLNALSQRRDKLFVNFWNQNSDGCVFRSGAAVFPYNSDALRAQAVSQKNGVDQIAADVFLSVPATDGKYQQAIFLVEAADFKPFDKSRFPAFVIYSRRQLGNIVVGRICFDVAQLPEIASRVRGMAGAATGADDEEPSAVLSDLVEQARCLLDCICI